MQTSTCPGRQAPGPLSQGQRVQGGRQRYPTAMKRVTDLLDALDTLGNGGGVRSVTLAEHLDWNVNTTRFYLWIVHKMGYVGYQGSRRGRHRRWELLGLDEMPDDVDLPAEGCNLRRWADEH